MLYQYSYQNKEEEWLNQNTYIRKCTSEKEAFLFDSLRNCINIHLIFFRTSTILGRNRAVLNIKRLWFIFFSKTSMTPYYCLDNKLFSFKPVKHWIKLFDPVDTVHLSLIIKKFYEFLGLTFLRSVRLENKTLPNGGPTINFDKL